ncbi:MAG: hypothetical protein HQK55_13305, partial [Deltaproteobacteria bacterium]|nr:hypothetical protein [Deltaproteobacteria bacterium]
MKLKHHKTSAPQQVIGLIVLMAISSLAVWVWQKQFDFNPAVLEAQKAGIGVGGQLQTATPDRPKTENDLAPTLPGLTIMSAPEAFGPDTLADKIDGKAELYLSSGFKTLKAQRLASTSNADLWLEIFLYDMGSGQNAYAVFSSQRRPEAEDVPETPLAYRTSNSLFLAHGGYYLEVIASQVSPDLPNLLVRVAHAMTAKLGPQAEALSEPSLFPLGGFKSGTLRLSASNVFGFEGLTYVFTGEYRLEAGEATAYISKRGQAAEAERLAKDYAGFLMTYGGREIKDDQIKTGMRVFNLD